MLCESNQCCLQYQKHKLKSPKIEISKILTNTLGFESPQFLSDWWSLLVNSDGFLSIPTIGVVESTVWQYQKSLTETFKRKNPNIPGWRLGWIKTSVQCCRLGMALWYHIGLFCDGIPNPAMIWGVKSVQFVVSETEGKITENRVFVSDSWYCPNKKIHAKRNQIRPEYVLDGLWTCWEYWDQFGNFGDGQRKFQNFVVFVMVILRSNIDTVGSLNFHVYRLSMKSHHIYVSHMILCHTKIIRCIQETSWADIQSISCLWILAWKNDTVWEPKSPAWVGKRMFHDKLMLEPITMILISTRKHI